MNLKKMFGESQVLKKNTINETGRTPRGKICKYNIFFLSIAMTALALAAMAYYFGQLYSLGGKGVSRQLTRQTILR